MVISRGKQVDPNDRVVFVDGSYVTKQYLQYQACILCPTPRMDMVLELGVHAKVDRFSIILLCKHYERHRIDLLRQQLDDATQGYQGAPRSCSKALRA